MSSPLRISLVNDYEIIVEGLRTMLAPFADRVVVVETEAGGLPDRSADIVLFDTFASRRDSLDRVRKIDEDPRSQRLVLYTWDAPQSFLDDIPIDSVDAVLPKSLFGEDLVVALERIAAGERVDIDLLSDDDDPIPTLTEREREVLALIARGMTNPAIARELYLSVDTVKTHVRTLFRKLDVTNRTQAALMARQFRVDDPFATDVRASSLAGDRGAI